MKVLIAGGGTGGHVIPGLAIARELRDTAGAEVRFVGTARGLETKLVPEAGFSLELIHVGQLKGVSLATRLRTLGDLPLGIAKCVAMLREFKPDVVVGVGGYASGPAMMAALLLRVPTVAYEPNAVPGLTNKLVGKFVSAAAVSYAQTTKYFRNATVTGVPVRATIFDVAPLTEAQTPRLLITAGSQGAKIFNDTMPLILSRLLEAVPGLTILHQAGARHIEATTAAFAASGADPSRWEVRAFIDDMPHQYAACTLVLARSGSTVAELAASGRPSLLVPFPQAADDHQRKNAEVLVQAGAATMMIQAGLTPEGLLEELTRMLNDAPGLVEMGANARTLAHPGALERIAGMALRVSRKTPN
ncbi:undecaprenyldiphospho-muramoylpentapeptide beta-N-acetylglucosaminyltransferase [Granulicella tundricola]|uniref:UDP-N-acetylglucosamine--N-acetylmuramyl-(pentapeptide) pyrophosphoryl-undecaprenol N-acetylglucosamine transferase n=1 Tax=Granulicella tundricola (strain ATCC BAA-1859 / DSM 23138 / MP5ACTX9) TaxID=1198114 RepID=E8WX92_GRATM|nr:undecaprenyldiphospho-muramoylpentapeptide beta-N-acetylglucosaminyltransferase [Granulicella tundricola]ADW69734.1 UDP-N-acetylglucosamine--N-acetylmuramyl-(pentapeptide) pyrophosphoryl-undecaprenol N-acetylglucosamine transferase [Granulicella tundricola MP5ACTX9]